MSLPSKILWSEGLTRGPQQFQQLDLYHEARLQRMAAAISPHLRGVCGLRCNHDELVNSTLRAETMSLIFQDGEIFDAPLSDMLPAAVDLSKLAPDQQSYTFYAALPMRNAHGGNLNHRDPARRSTARRPTCTRRPSTSTSATCARPCACCRTSNRAAPTSASRWCGRLVSGGFEIDPSFMPPSLSLAAAGLQQMLDSLLGKLNVKIEALYKRHRQPTKHATEVHSGDFASFWMRNTISSAGAALTHCARYRQHHPAALFERLMTLAGGLMTFSTRYALADLPPRRRRPRVRAARRLDPRPGRHGHLVQILHHRAGTAGTELVAVVPLRFKVGSPDGIERIIGLALPGIELLHLTQVPAEVPVQPNTYYFSVESKGALYDDMMKAQAIAIHVPTGMKGLRLELFGITP